ncbi:MAG: hypothetical protein V1880_02975 [Patescibacteria group bacterium]
MARKTLQRLFAAMASAIVTILVSAMAEAQKPGIIDRARNKAGQVVEQGRQAKEKAKEVVETVTEGAEKTADFWNHAQNFWNQMSWRDFVGRNWQHGLVIGLVMAAVSLFILREWDERKAVIALLKGYAAGVVCGFIYELLRTAPDSSVQGGSRSLMVVAALLFAVMAIMHSFRFIPKLREAIAAREVPYFLWHRQLPSVITDWQGDEGGADSQPDNGSGTTPQPAPGPAPDPDASPTPPVTPAPSARLITCPACHKQTETKGRRCGHCQAFLPRDGGPAVVIVSADSVVCPHCHKQTEAKGRRCGHCLEPVEEERKTPPVTEETREKGGTKEDSDILNLTF